MEKQLLERLDRIERKLSMLMQEKKKETWVKAPVITGMTGWDGNKMRRARENGYIKFKKDNGCFFYDVESLHSVHIKQSA